MRCWSGWVIKPDFPCSRRHFATACRLAKRTYSRKASPIVYVMGPAPFSEILLTVIDNNDHATELIGRRMVPVRGYAGRLFSSLLQHTNGCIDVGSGAQRELSQYAAAFALTIAPKLYDNIHPRSKDPRMHNRNLLASARQKIMEVASIVLDDYFESSHIQHLTKSTEGESVRRLPCPPSLSSEMGGPGPGGWNRVRQAILDLAQLILGFASLGDPSVCEELLIGDALLYDTFGFNAQLGDHERQIMVGKNIWYNTLGFLLLGKRFETYDEQERRDGTCMPHLVKKPETLLLSRISIRCERLNRLTIYSRLLFILLLWLEYIQRHTRC